MDKEKRQQLIIKACCVLASFCLWLYISNVENPVTTYTLKDVPVTLKNVENLSKYELTLIDSEDYYVDLTIKGVKSEVYNVKPEDIKIVADLSAYSLKNGENRVFVEIKQTPRNVSVLNTGNLWVKVNLDELVEKSVPIKVYVKGEPKEGYYAHEVVIKPTDVVVYGASKYVNAVSRAIAEVDIDNADTNTVATLSLRAVDNLKRTIENVNIKPELVEAVVPINKIRAVDVKVVTEGNLGDNYQLIKVTPSINKISVVGDKDKIENIKYIESKPINLNEITSDVTKDIELVLPEGVTIINLEEAVKVNIDIERVLQRNYSLTINYKNTGEGYNISTVNKNASVIIEGSENVINSINYGDITCEVNLLLLEEGEHTVPVNVSIPTGVKIISINPENVKVNLTKEEKKEDNTQNEASKVVDNKQLEEKDVNTSE